MVYLAILEASVSAMLVREEKGTQPPIYYVSKALIDAAIRYPHPEKFSLALVMHPQKIRPYFQCHSISLVATFVLVKINSVCGSLK